MNQSTPIESSYQVVPIGKVISPFKQKFTVPRQPRLLSLAKGYIELFKPFDDLHALSSLADFSHIWVLFWFHLNPENKSASFEQYKWQPMVRPPRLGGKEKVGVFASRSPFRPNPIGMSVYKLDGIEKNSKGIKIHINGIDVVDGTPVIDIKPYIPFSDSVTDAKGGFAQDIPVMPFNVIFSDKALAELYHLAKNQGHSESYAKEVEQFILQVLSQDARPSYHQNKMNVDMSKKQYGVDLLEYNIKWLLDENQVIITDVSLTKNR
ncbi:tRNA (N6-threonylcarbamoyladenosine(37)-N6)-methyltransferase TrmO [Thorsellia kenyensis]|uniref:tRNA (N6-threonylcarbamoyladenosine(37)-N6)-methyltransferase TrmO n=1 Tax=Thorsellia kenyensis TaxID=1549888 RepID=A0ABN0R2M4_9GAMM